MTIHWMYQIILYFTRNAFANAYLAKRVNRGEKARQNPYYRSNSWCMWHTNIISLKYHIQFTYHWHFNIVLCALHSLNLFRYEQKCKIFSRFFYGEIRVNIIWFTTTGISFNMQIDGHISNYDRLNSQVLITCILRCRSARVCVV